MNTTAAPSLIPLTVLGGYLGAGKTTVINSLLRRAGSSRIAVLVNDFGEINIDVEILRARNDGIVELSGGCVCCDLSLGMGPALDQLLAIDPPPDHVVVEVSGVGEPASVASWGHTPGFRPDGIAVVAALDRIRELAADRWVSDLVTAQLRQADILLCTRGDLLSRQERVEVTAWLAEQSSAPQVTATHGGVPDAVLFGFDHARNASAPPTPPQHVKDANRFTRATAWSTDAAVDTDALAAALAAIPGLLRAKGFALTEPDGAWALVQAVGSRVECTPWEPGPGVAKPSAPILTVLTTPDVDDAAIAAALPTWRPLSAR